MEKDERIYAWDLWNEPGNSNRHDMSIPYLKRVFELGKKHGSGAASDCRGVELSGGLRGERGSGRGAHQRLALDESDIVTFHQYEDFERVKRTVARLKKEGRPMMNTEWLKPGTGQLHSG